MAATTRPLVRVLANAALRAGAGAAQIPAAARWSREGNADGGDHAPSGPRSCERGSARRRGDCTDSRGRPLVAGGECRWRRPRALWSAFLRTRLCAPARGLQRFPRPAAGRGRGMPMAATARPLVRVLANAALRAGAGTAEISAAGRWSREGNADGGDRAPSGPRSCERGSARRRGGCTDSRGRPLVAGGECRWRRPRALRSAFLRTRLCAPARGLQRFPRPAAGRGRGMPMAATARPLVRVLANAALRAGAGAAQIRAAGRWSREGNADGDDHAPSGPRSCERGSARRRGDCRDFRGRPLVAGGECRWRRPRALWSAFLRTRLCAPARGLQRFPRPAAGRGRGMPMAATTRPLVRVLANAALRAGAGTAEISAAGRWSREGNADGGDRAPSGPRSCERGSARRRGGCRP
jgi:hypothetical protein